MFYSIFLRGTREFHPITTTCPVCGREHITVFRLRHISDDFFRRVGLYYRYARHFNWRRMRWCTNSERAPNW